MHIPPVRRKRIPNRRLAQRRSVARTIDLVRRRQMPPDMLNAVIQGLWRDAKGGQE